MQECEHDLDEVYRRLNRYRRGSSFDEGTKMEEQEALLIDGKLATMHVAPHGAHKWSLTEAQVSTL